VKRADRATWESVNPTLAPGEPGCELDTHLLKMGDGVTDWQNLPYVGTYNGPTVDTDLKEYVKFADLAEALKDYMPKMQIASGTILGAVKSSDEQNKIKVLDDGTMEVNSLNINKLV
jgi:hyaluronoglucosaminidase